MGTGSRITQGKVKSIRYSKKCLQYSLLVMALQSSAWAAPATSTTWQGGSSADWFDSSNWSAGLPTQQAPQTFVYITSPVPGVQPIITTPGAVANHMFLGSVGGSGLNVSAGGTLTASSIIVSNSSNNGSTSNITQQSGVLNVMGNGSTVTTSDLTLGYYSAGTLTVSNGGSVVVASAVSLGSLANATSHGTLNVSGNGSAFTSSGSGGFFVGGEGRGDFSLSDGATASTYGGSIGSNAGSQGNAKVSGQNTTWNVTNASLVVGQSGKGDLKVHEGAVITVAQNALKIGSSASGVGTVEVKGAGSRISSQGTTGSDYLAVGQNGKGTLVIREGGVVDAYFNILGAGTTGKGDLILDGVGSMAHSTSYTMIGWQGSATATVSNGSTLRADGVSGIRVAFSSGSSGTLNIGAAAEDTATGAGHILANGITFGAGTGKLVFNHTDANYVLASALAGGGTVEALAGTSILTGDNSNFSGSFNVNGGKLVLASDTAAATATVNAAGTLQIGNGGTAGALSSNIVNQGALVFNRADALTHASEISGNGSLTVAGGAITLSGLNTYTGATTVGAGATLALAGQGSINQSSNLTVNGIFDVTQSASAQVKDLGGSGRVVVGQAGLMIADASQAFAGKITGDGGVNVAGGVLSLTGDNDFASLDISNGATVNIGAGGASGSMLADVTNAGSLVFNRSDNVSYAGQITGPGTVVKTGVNTLSLTGSMSGGRLDVHQGTAQVLGSISSHAKVGVGGTLVFANPAATTYQGQLSGTGSVVKAGNGTTTFSGDSSAFAGTTTLAGGTALLTGKLGGEVLIQSAGVLQVGNGLIDGDLSANTVNNGTLVFNQSKDYDFKGALSGNGSLIKKGNNTLLLSGNYHYTGSTIIEGGLVRLAAQLDEQTDLVIDSGTFDLGGKVQLVSGLKGSAGNLLLTGGALTVQQLLDSIFAGSLTGDGTSSFTKSGSGLLNLTGLSSYTGQVHINGGILAVNGALPGHVSVHQGGTLGGTGLIGALKVHQGGILAPGNSIGTLNVSGDVQFDAGSVYAVEVDAAGNSDKLAATGAATLHGGTVQVLAESGAYNPYTSYVILDAGGGVSGRFENVTSNFAFLTPELVYAPNTVSLALARNDVDFAQVAITSNQRATAGAIKGTFGAGSAVYQSLFTSTAEGARQTFDALSGEVHASTLSAVAQQTETLRRTALERLDVDAKGTQLWAQASGELAHLKGNGNSAKVSVRDGGGMTLGVDTDLGAVRVGLAATYASSDVKVNQRGSSADTKALSATLYAGTRLGALALRAGASYSDLRFKTSRHVAVGALSDHLTAKYDGKATTLFGELGYPVQLAAGHLIEPFVGVNALWLKNDSFNEHGGSLALRGESRSRNYAWSTLGVKGSFVLGQTQPVIVSAKLGWQHALSKRDVESELAFAQGGPTYGVQGAPLARDAALVDFNLDWRLTSSTRFGIGYAGSLANQGSSHTAKAVLRTQF